MWTYLYFGIIIIIQTVLLERFNFEYNLQLLHFSTNYIIYFIGNLNAIFFWLKVSKILSKYIGNSRIIQLIGNNTYSIMLHHVFAFFIMNTGILLIYKLTGFFSKFDFNNYQNHFFYFYNENPGLQLIYVIVGISFPLLGNVLYKRVKEKIVIKLKHRFTKVRMQ